MSPSLAEVTAALTAPGAHFEIEEVEIRGVLTRVWKNAPLSLRTVLEQSTLHAEKTFLVYEDERMTFAEHFRTVARLAPHLAAFKVPEMIDVRGQPLTRNANGKLLRQQLKQELGAREVEVM
jgi:hypothetical protein